jgi:DNA-binding NarL/FixJ family response regulator
LTLLVQSDLCGPAKDSRTTVQLFDPVLVSPRLVRARNEVEGMAARLRVLICEQGLLVRDGLRTLLDAEDDIDVIETTDNGLHALTLAQTHHPDVVVTGLALSSMDGIELTRRLCHETLDPAPRVIVFVTGDNNSVLADVVRAGATGVLTSDTSREELARTVRVVARGQAMLAPGVAQVLLQWLRGLEAQPEEQLQSVLATLTPREYQVLQLTARGLSAEELATKLSICVATVRTHIYRLRCKLQVQDRAQLVAFAFRAGLMQRRPLDQPKTELSTVSGLRRQPVAD